MDPIITASVLTGFSKIFRAARPYAEQVSQTDPADIQAQAANQIQLTTAYYTAVLAQARQSFISALVAAAIGLAFFMGAIGFALTRDDEFLAAVCGIGGVIVEVIAGLQFYLYGKTADQLAAFHQRLDLIQRLLMANSVCSSIEGDLRDETRADLVVIIAEGRSLTATNGNV